MTQETVRPGWTARDRVASAGAPGEPVSAYLGRLLAEQAANAEGELPDYIPELTRASRDWFGIALATSEGARYESGDSRQPFTLQSLCKPFVYGLALDLCGEAEVRSRVGVEPSGDAFNSITLTPGTGTPLNPMVNAGAIAVAGLVAEAAADPRGAIRALLSAAAGRELVPDEAVHRSEAETGFRNRAIAHLLRNFEVITGAPDEVVDLYFESCSILVDTRDVALMAATLANGGVHPTSGARVLSPAAVRAVLSVMTSCGMYNSAGEWLHTVGLPAKSGVSGGVLAVVPGRIGIGVFSPPLDERGNSVRGLAVCRELSRSLNLHLVDRSHGAVVPLRGVYSIAEVASRRVRSDEQRRSLRQHGAGGLVVELQGELAFAAVEHLSRRVLGVASAQDAPLHAVVIDLSRVERADPAVAPLLGELVRTLAAAGIRLDLAAAQRHAPFLTALDDDLALLGGRAPLAFGELDLALESYEDLLLDAYGPPRRSRRVPLAEHDLLRGLDAAQLDRVERLLERRSYAAGELVLAQGERAEELLLVSCGELSVAVEGPGGERRRLATVSGGMVLGVLSVDERTGRTADVWADTDAECLLLGLGAFDALGHDDPVLKCRLLENLLALASEVARRLDRELATLRA